MLDLLAWYNLIFLIPLALGLILAVGTATGIGEYGHDVDMDGDGIPDDFHADGDHGAHDGEARSGFTGYLGIGKAPTSLVIMTILLTYGGLGFVWNFLLEPLRHSFGDITPTVLSVGLDIGVTLMSVGFLTRTFGRLLPSKETSSTTLGDLIGATGVVTLGILRPGPVEGTEVSPCCGSAQVSVDGDIYNILVRADEEIPQGTRVLVVGYDGSRGVHIVVRSAVSALDG